MIKKGIALLAVVLLLGLSGCQLANEAGTEPVAIIVADPVEGPPPLTVRFDGSRSLNAVTYEWDFGDGAVDYGPLVSHTYTEKGLYRAVLTVRGPTGREDQTAVTIRVREYGPVPIMRLSGDLSGGGTDFAAGELITFDATASYDPDGVIVRYSWGFGDGSMDTGPIVHHWYIGPSCGEQPLRYVVTLEVEDDDGHVASTTKVITIHGRCGR